MFYSFIIKFLVADIRYPGIPHSQSVMCMSVHSKQAERMGCTFCKELPVSWIKIFKEAFLKHMIHNYVALCLDAGYRLLRIYCSVSHQSQCSDKA